MSGTRYAELQVTSQFSFLRGASSAQELFATAAAMGQHGALRTLICPGPFDWGVAETSR